MPTPTPALDAWMGREDIYIADEAADQAFVAALRECLAWHLERHAGYAEHARRQGFCLEHLQGIEDVPRVPHVFVNVFKHHELLSIPADQVALRLTSSGTGGQQSQVFFDARSLARGLGMVDVAHREMGLTRPDTPTNYVLFAYDPEEAKHVGTAFTDRNIAQYAPARGHYHALRWDAAAGDFRFREAEALATVERYAEEGLPVRFLGFPAFLHRLIARLKEQRHPPFAFGPDSFVLTGGGWKTSEAERIEPAQFRAEVEDMLGIPASNVRDGYGMVEHGVPYLQCEHHRFHVPGYARAYARDIATLELLPAGEVGFLELVSPYNLAMPTHALLTSDLGAVVPGCPCGRGTPTLELRGRAGTRKNKGCAVSASRMLEESAHA